MQNTPLDIKGEGMHALSPLMFKGEDEGFFAFGAGLFLRTDRV